MGAVDNEWMWPSPEEAKDAPAKRPVALVGAATDVATSGLFGGPSSVGNGVGEAGASPYTAACPPEIEASVDEGPSLYENKRPQKSTRGDWDNDWRRRGHDWWNSNEAWDESAESSRPALRRRGKGQWHSADHDGGTDDVAEEGSWDDSGDRGAGKRGKKGKGKGGKYDEFTEGKGLWADNAGKSKGR